MLCMLTAKKDPRGLPVFMNKVELAHRGTVLLMVVAGLKKVFSRLITQCAFKCSMAQLISLRMQLSGHIKVYSH